MEVCEPDTYSILTDLSYVVGSESDPIRSINIVPATCHNSRASTFDRVQLQTLWYRQIATYVYVNCQRYLCVDAFIGPGGSRLNDARSYCDNNILATNLQSRLAINLQIA